MRTKYESEQFNGVCCFLLNPEWNRKIKWKRNAAPKYNENNDFDKEIGTCDDNGKVKIQQLNLGRTECSEYWVDSTQVQNRS